MRIQTTVLLLLLLLTGLLWFVRIPLKTVPIFGTSETVAIPEPEDAAGPILQEWPVPSYQQAFSNLPVIEPTVEQGRFHDRLFNSPLTNSLKSRSGSYTNLSDFFQGDATFSADLQSRWLLPYLFPDRDLPELRMRITKDPETGEYRISGGGLSLPKTGLEAGYEVEFGSDEHKATLQWKKEF